MPREEMPMDVLFVGAGPANLVGAIHLKNLIDQHNEAIAEGKKSGDALDVQIGILEKGGEVGAHQLSGAVLDPKAMDEFMPGWRDQAPIEQTIADDRMVFLTGSGAITAPWVPPELHNTGKPIISLGKFCKWLGGVAEEKGVMVLPGFAGAELLWDGDRVAGVRTGDKGIDGHGVPTDSYEPGMNITARVTVLGEGPRGHLARRLIERRGLDRNSNPMVYEVGCKEVLQLPEGTIKEGFAIHGLGYPLDLGTFGGWFLYSMGNDQVALGMLVALDAKDPMMDCHELLQRLKTHPYVKERLKGAKVIKYGAKTVTIGGWSSMPQLYTDGAMIVGDSASFLNPFRIKGIHLSMKSGMCAAQAAFDALVKGDASAATLAAYKAGIDASWVRTEMEKTKNFHAYFHNGLVLGMARAGWMWMFGPGSSTLPFEADHAHMKTLKEYAKSGPQITEKLTYDGQYLLDKLTDVYLSGTAHNEHQPAHLKVLDTEVCATTCRETYGNPCTRFCPAQVYNMVPNEANGGRLELRVDFSNCVHCKTCDIRDPYQIITWVPPEAGEGPVYGIL